ncbi:hypothetical protein [Dyadobacter frigoris]|uniref:Uncharacterized protein n=1 Tax=Dyadobacter frigoris TaxID=2576211 RepID=A0A4V6BI99_9BACT|nr:hypothetical protein [Dyadobacter frigoris]TKT89493.1 hypothetical protein FDK13_24430 [Dyadobacter frigoris]
MPLFTDLITVVYGLSNQSADYIARTYDRHQIGPFLAKKIEDKEYQRTLDAPGFEFIEKLGDREHKTHAFVFRAGSDRAEVLSYSGNGIG